jgi:beta-glucanase (GH16 family)
VFSQSRPGAHARAGGRRDAARACVAVVAAALVGSAGWLPAASASALPGAGARAVWRTVFSDHFTGRAGSGAGSRWTYDIGTQYNGGSCPASWGTGEVESGSASTVNVHRDGHGHLLITPVKSGGRWTSGRIETVSAKFSAPAGGEMKVTASIKQPAPAHGLGYWPAFWMLGAGFRARGAGTSGIMNCPKWPSVGEIDIMEDVNALSEQAGTLHCGIAPGGPCNEFTGLSSGLQLCPGCQSGYHTYSVIVDRTNTSSESITWYLDGSAYFTVTENQVGAAAWKAAVDHGFFLILDVAIGGAFPDPVCGCTTPVSSTTSGAAMGVQYVTVSVR